MGKEIMQLSDGTDAVLKEKEKLVLELEKLRVDLEIAEDTQATLLTTNNRNNKIINRLRDKVLEEQAATSAAKDRAQRLEVELLSAGALADQQAAAAVGEILLEDAGVAADETDRLEELLQKDDRERDCQRSAALARLTLMVRLSFIESSFRS